MDDAPKMNQFREENSVKPIRTHQVREPSHESQPQSNQTETLQDRLIRAFNTALLSTKTRELSDASDELDELFREPAFRSILKAISQLALDEGISEQEAAAKIVHVSRRIDRIWSDYLLLQGLERVKNPQGNGA